jgi:hypothetical protein
LESYRAAKPSRSKFERLAKRFFIVLGFSSHHPPTKWDMKFWDGNFLTHARALRLQNARMCWDTLYDPHRSFVQPVQVLSVGDFRRGIHQFRSINSHWFFFQAREGLILICPCPTVVRDQSLAMVAWGGIWTALDRRNSALAG